VVVAAEGLSNPATGASVAFGQVAAVGEGTFDRAEQTATSGVAFATVTVDPDLLEVKLLKLALAVDAGRLINPMLAEHQIIGGAMQGIGGALLEEIRYDEFGQPTQATFMDYHVPLAVHLPELTIETFEFPAISNPLGAKGVGELGIVGVAAAVSNAVADALGRMPESVPCTRSVVAKLLQTPKENTVSNG
jgi:CO/xanthine dehydrogenase Mo-binding subunit